MRPILACRTGLRALLLMACAALGAAAASGADLRIGLKAEITSADPHVLNPANRNAWLHVYETLVTQDAKLRATPCLARGWRAVDATTWDFVLRPGVLFHDGTPFTAEDAKASIDRAMALPGPRTYRSYLKDIDSVQVLEPLKLQIRTKLPSPGLPDNISLIAILPKSQAKATEEAFASGAAAIGTGRYRFESWTRGDRTVLVRNDKHWEGREPWDKVILQSFPKDPARASALLSGAVDLIDGAHAGLSDAFAGRAEISSTTSYWLNYLQLDQFRANSPFVTDLAGKPLAANPFKDLRVRQAINLAINREGIVRHVMKGDAVPAAQFVPADFFGYDPAIVPVPADMAKAKALLAQAGFAQGFRMTLHCPNDRYLNDARVCEAIGQMLTQAGLKVEVSTLPFAVFQTRMIAGGANKEPEFSAQMTGIGTPTGDSWTALHAVVHTHDKQKGDGANNYGRYSNPKLDELIHKASQTISPTERESLQKQAAKLLADDLGVIPIHHLKASWALRRGLSIAPRADGFTFATSVREGAVKP